MGSTRLYLENGDFFAYTSPHTPQLKWGQVIEEPSEPDFLMCRTFTSDQPDGTECLVNTTQAALMFRVDPWVFDFAREQGWPETVEQLYSLSRARKDAVEAASS